MNKTILVQETKGNWIRGEYKQRLFYAKVYNEPSEYGIDKGRVSKLTVYGDKDNVIFHYDRVIDLDNPIGHEIADVIEKEKIFI